jgi:hypothetical protein
MERKMDFWEKNHIGKGKNRNDLGNINTHEQLLLFLYSSDFRRALSTQCFESIKVDRGWKGCYSQTIVGVLGFQEKEFLCFRKPKRYG